MKYVPPLNAATENAPYIDGNPEHGIEGSPVPANALEHPQREIVNVIRSANMTPDPADLTQLTQAVQVLSGVGRAQRTWTLETPVARGSTLNLPPEVAYTVGAGALVLAWDGMILTASNYSELGEIGTSSKAVVLSFDAPAGAEFFAALTAAGGGTVGIVIPPDVRQRLDATIARADAAAIAAEKAVSHMGDTLYAVPQE